MATLSRYRVIKKYDLFIKVAIRSQFAFLVLAMVFVWLSVAGNASSVAASTLKSTPTLPLEPKITGKNISQLRQQKIIGKSANIPGPYAPVGGINVMFSPKGTYIASDYNTKGALQIWNIRTGQRVAYLPGQYVRVVQAVFTPDERFVATSDFDGTFRIWSLTTLRSKIVDIDAGDWAVTNSIAASADGHTFAVGNDGNQVTLVDAETGNIKQILTGTSVSTLLSSHFVRFSPNGSFLVSIASQYLPDAPGTNAILTVWDLKTGKPSLELVGDSCTVNFWASFSSEGALFVASTSKSNTNACDISEYFGIAPIRTVHIWDLPSLRDGASFYVHRNYSDNLPVEFSSDGKFVAVGESPNEIAVYRLGAGSAPERIDDVGKISGYQSDFNVDGSLILTGDKIWDTNTSKQVASWTNQTYGSLSHQIIDAVFSPDGTTIGLLMVDSTIQLWRIQ